MGKYLLCPVNNDDCGQKAFILSETISYDTKKIARNQNKRLNSQMGKIARTFCTTVSKQDSVGAKKIVIYYNYENVHQKSYLKSGFNYEINLII